MTDPLATLLVNVEWHAVELKRDRGGDYLQEAETESGITLAEIVKRYNALISQLAPRPSPALAQECGHEAHLYIRSSIFGWTRDEKGDRVEDSGCLMCYTIELEDKLARQPALPVDAVTAVVELAELVRHYLRFADENLYCANVKKQADWEALHSETVDALAALAAKELR